MGHYFNFDEMCIRDSNSEEPDKMSGVWKEKMVNNPKAVTYGNGVAEIIDYAVIDLSLIHILLCISQQKVTWTEVLRIRKFLLKQTFLERPLC